jgi:hypothetical protein
MFRGAIARILTFTTARRMPLKLSFVIMLASLATPILRAQLYDSHSQSDLEERVRRLGLPGDNDDLADVQVLSKTPYEAVGALIRELHPIADPERSGHDDAPATEHLISTIAALRYLTGGNNFYLLTGKDFCGKTSWKFGKSEEEQSRRYWLYFDHSTCASFFGIWPSRYRVYLAPLDAQEEIIQHWRDWFAREGKAYQFTPPPDSPDKNLLLWQCARAVYWPPGAH